MLFIVGLWGGIVITYGVSFWYAFKYYQNLENFNDRLAVRWLVAGFALECILFIGRWVTDRYAPLASLDGIFLALSIALALALILGRFKAQVSVLTSLFLPFIFLLACFGLAAGLKPTLLIEARLMTLGMASHIFFIFLGFAHFTLGFGVGAAFWIQEGQLKQHQIKSWSYRLPALEVLDSLTAYYIGLGFLFWLAGLSLGTYQALQVFGKMPLGDPKILGSLLVLIIYACFFLLRWGLKMRGRKSMVLVMAGYFLALFTFLGVRVFLTTFHAF
jgi:HemX protein